MNCDTFLDLLHEYLDETLDAEVDSSLRQHLQQCAACRDALQREQTLAAALRISLERATAAISLRPQLQQNVIRALEARPVVANSRWRDWPDFIFLRWRLLGSAATVLILFGLYFGLSSHRQKTVSAVPKAAAPPAHYICVITVPLQTQTHVFRQRNNTIEDAVISGTGLGYASLFEDRNPAPKTP